jgi:hypothetical protein
VNKQKERKREMAESSAQEMMPAVVERKAYASFFEKHGVYQWGDINSRRGTGGDRKG